MDISIQETKENVWNAHEVQKSVVKMLFGGGGLVSKSLKKKK